MSGIQRKGTALQRGLKGLFCVLFGFLAYWLLGYLIDDLGHVQAPNYSDIEKRLIDPDLLKKSESLTQKATEIQNELSSQQQQQQNLRDSTSSAQTTMNQLLAFQKLSLEKGVKPTEEEQQALAESQKVFLANQKQYQKLTEEIGMLQLQLTKVREESRQLDQSLASVRAGANEEYAKLIRRQEFWEAAVKLGILTPLLVGALWLFYRTRGSIYVPLYVAFAVAVAFKVLFVMHEYFPSRAFRYVLIVTSLIVVTRALIALLRSIARPGVQLLLNQYREAYEYFVCPNCNFPIRRGPLKSLYWTRRTLKKLRIVPTDSGAVEKPYCCPSCSTQLFEECSNCQQVRHSLLPTCEHCGTTRPLEENAAV